MKNDSQLKFQVFFFMDGVKSSFIFRLNELTRHDQMYLVKFGKTF